MTVDPRAALDRLTAALEAHFNAVTTRRSEDDPGVDDAYDVLADAFEVYDDSLVTIYGEQTPFYLVDDDVDDDDDDEDDEDEDGAGDRTDPDDDYDDDVELIDEIDDQR